MGNQELEQAIAAFKLFELSQLLALFLGITLLIGCARLIRSMGRRLDANLPSKRLLISQVTTSLVFFIYLFGGAWVGFAALRPSRELLLAITGSAAVAIGFSLKDIVASVVAGFILLFDRPFQVGDRVTFDGTYGEIKSIGLRAVRLVTLDDNLVTIPNSKFMTDLVASGNAGYLNMMVVTDFHVALDSDLQKARDLIHDVLVTSRFVYVKKPVIINIAEMALAERLCIQIKAKAYVLDVRYEKDFQTDVYLRGTVALAAGGIKRPPLAL